MKTLEQCEKERMHPVVVYYADRTILMGWASDPRERPLRLHRARMCVRYSAATRGALGLASIGPQESTDDSPTSVVSPPVAFVQPHIEIIDVVPAEPAAVAQWELLGRV